MKMKEKWTRFRALSGRNEGFTLVELIVVIAILGILAGVAVPAYNGYITKANEAADNQLLAAVNTAFASACVENGEFDMKNLSARPQATLNQETGAVEKMSMYDEDFQRYFANSGVFKYFDVLGFDSSLGVFVGNTIAALGEAFANAWEGSSFSLADDGGEQVLEMLSMTFDQIGSYFANGFSLDNLLAGMPEEVQNAFNFGTFDMEFEQILEKYVDGYAKMSEEEKVAYKDNLTEDQKQAIAGNAYVMQFAEASQAATAEEITADVDKLLTALMTTNGKTDEELWQMFKKNNPGTTYTSYQQLVEACGSDALASYGLNEKMLVAVAATGVTNESGISTLGSLYALAAGFYNSGMATTAKPSDFSTFPAVLSAMMDSEFTTYLNGTEDQPSQAQKDLNAYLSYMEYISANGVTMNSKEAFEGQYKDIWALISGSAEG